jgi:hypothetical protein
MSGSSITSKEIAASLLLALGARTGKTVDRESILQLPIPTDAATRKSFSRIAEHYKTTDHTSAIEAIIDKLDAIVGDALGLENEDIAAIRADMMTDAFLRNIKPRYPATTTRLHGYRTGLDSSERYK